MRFRPSIYTLAVCLLVVSTPLLLPVPAWSDGGDVLWERTFHEGNDFATSVASHGGRVFAGGFMQFESADDVNVVRAFSARTGRVLWTRRAPKVADSESVLLAVAGHVLVASLGPTIQAYHAHTGAVVWEDDDPGGRVSGIAAGEHLVVAVGSRLAGGRLVRAYDPATGELLWEDVSDAPEDRETAFAVAVVAGRVFVAGERTDSQGRGTLRVRAYRARTGRLIWEDSGSGDGAGPGSTSVGFAVVSHAGVVAVAGERDLNPFVRAWAAGTGRPLWQHEVPQDPGLPTVGFFDAADVQGRRLIVGGSRGGFLVQALDLWTGALHWEQRSRTALGVALAVTHAARTVVATGLDDRNWLVQAYDARSGRLLWEDRIAGPGGAAIARDDEATHGRVFVVGEVNQGDPDAADAVIRAYDLR